MGSFIVELYVARGEEPALARAVELTRLAAERLTRDGAPVRRVRAIFVPEDETCFLLVEADAAETVGEVARQAALPFERIVETAVDRFGFTNA